MRRSFDARLLRGALLLTFSALLSACSSGTQQTPSAAGLGAQAAVAAPLAHAVGAPAGHQESKGAQARPKGLFGPDFRQGFTGGYNTHPDGSGTVVYDSILTNPKGQTSSYIASLGYECCSTNEFGDGLVLTQPGRLKSIEVVMDSWACQTGGVYQDTCESAKGSKFSWPITANVYSITGYPSGVPTVGQLLATRTQTFAIPYRPSANNKVCTGPNLGGFLGPVDKECDYGLAAPITFNMNVPIVQLPGQVIVTVSFNTSDYGPNPAGHNTTCFQAGNCPYDSLNVSAWGNGGLVGSNVDPNGTFVNFQNPIFYCANNPNGQPAGGSLVLDTPCWTGYHPEIKVTTF